MGAFAQDVRTGRYSKGTRVRVQTVQVALRAIGTTCELDGFTNPCYTTGQASYLKPIQRLLNAYTKEDPPPKLKLAVPVNIIAYIYAMMSNRRTPKRCLIANLCNVAFYYLLRSVEYTYTGKDTQTQRLCVGDITFWHGTVALTTDDTLTQGKGTTAALSLIHI